MLTGRLVKLYKVYLQELLLVEFILGDQLGPFQVVGRWKQFFLHFDNPETEDKI